MSTISETNRNKAYHEHEFKGSQCSTIKALLSAVPTGLTIGDLSRITWLPKSTVSGRINDLKPAVVEAGARYDEVSNTHVTVWKWVGEQPLLFEFGKQTPAKKLKKINELCLKEPCDLAHKINQIINSKN